MAVNAYREPGDGGVAGGMPADLMMDLLVDAELPEAERAVLLRKLEARGGEGWKELSLRFLQRQVEKETVRQLMAGGSIMPVEMTPPRAFRLSRWLKSTSVMATAAGLLIAATSALITLYVARMPAGGSTGTPVQFTGSLPGAAVGQAESIPVSVPVLRNAPDASGNIFPVSMQETPSSSRRSVVFQRDGHGNIVAIPVVTRDVQ